MKLILASASPRRRELLSLITDEFEVLASNCNEQLPPGIAPEDGVLRLAEQKAMDIAARRQGDTVIGADTVVVLNGEILGKPKDEQDAVCMLTKLSGRTHTVYTGVCILREGQPASFFCKTDVVFFPLTESEIIQYVKTGEPLDKAGAYGIQQKGALLVRSIDGDYFNVVGLPISQLARKLQEDA